LHKIRSSGQSTLLATGVKEVDKEISTLLNGIALSDLLASNVVLQKDLNRLAQMPKMERRHVINAMMGRECFSRADDKLALELRPMKKALEPERKALEQLQRRKDDFLKQSEEKEAKQVKLTQLDEQLKQMSQALAKTEKSHNAVKAYKEIHDKQEELQREIEYRAETKQRLTKQLTTAPKLQSQQKRLKKQQKQLDHLTDDRKAVTSLQDNSRKLRTLLDELQMVSEAIGGLEGQLEGVTPIDDVVLEYESVKTQRQDAETSQKKIFSPLLYIPSIGLIAAGIGSIFFNLFLGLVLILAAIPFLLYLGRAYLRYRRSAPKLEQLRLKEQQLGDQIADFRAKETIQVQLQEQRTRKETLNKAVSATSDQVHSQLGTLSSAMLEGIEIPSELNAIELQDTVRTIEQNFLKREAGAQALTEQLASIEEQLAGLSEAEDDLTQTESDISKLNEELSSLKFPTLPKELGPFSETLFEDLDQKVREMREEKVRLQTTRKNTIDRIDELTILLKENEGVPEEFSEKDREVAQLDENIKTGQIIIDLIREVAERGREQVRPRVVNVMERLLAAITDGKYRFPKLSEDYSLKVYSSTAGEYVEANLYSGGTEDQFLLALRLGFAIALLPHGRGTAPQFLLLDEPFGGSDIQRRDNIIRLLQDELSRTFQQIIVVSHQNAVLSASEHQYRMVNGRIIHSD
jgi:exonuclease SbcC